MNPLKFIRTLNETEPEMARQEYITRNVLFFLFIVDFSFTLISFVLYLYGKMPLDTVIIYSITLIALFVAMFFTAKGYWRSVGIIPPLFMYFIAINANYIGGIDAPGNFLYALLIMFVAIIYGYRKMWIALVICLATYLYLTWMISIGHIIPYRTAETVFVNRVVITSGSLILIALMIWILSRSYKKEIDVRIKAEEALRESEENYRTIFENTGTSMILIEDDMTISMANVEFVRNTGYSLDEINGRMKWTDLVHPDEIGQMTEQHRLRRENSGCALPGYEFRYITKTGDLRDALLSIQLVPGTEQSVASLIDITERKRTEDALVKSEEKFRLITENMVDCVALVDSNGIYKYVTPSYRNILGYDPEDMIGLKGLSLVHPDDLERITRIYLEGIEQCWSEKYFETRTLHKDGRYVNMEIRARLLNDSQGKVIGAIWSARDITKRLQLEQERRQGEEKLQQTLESLRKAVGTTVQVLVSAVESRDSYTAGHQSRSANLACAIATEMGLDGEKIEGILMAGIIHDIGKLSIPAEILSKPTKLTDIEFSLIKEHSRCGYGMLKDVESPWPLAQIVYQHHERMDGSGYPRNLKGDEILMEARILAVADVVEAMASHRPYRPTLGIEMALEEIEKNRGILYDNAVAVACLRLFRDKGYQLT
jgi:PAS domain S-box-containing protein